MDILAKAKDMNTQDQIVKIIAEHALLEPNDIALNNSLAELGIDSLALVESIFAIEETFDITVPFNANDPQASEFDISTVESIITAVDRLKSEQTG